jgi:hypothetical protein
MSDEPTSHDEDFLVPDAPEEPAEAQRASTREQLSDTAGGETADDPELEIGLPGGGGDRVRGYE